MAYSPPPGGNQPGWNPHQPPPQQPPPPGSGYPPQPGAGMPQPGSPGQPPPGGYGPPPGMPPGGYPPQPPNKSKTGVIVGCALAAVVLIAGIALVVIQPWTESEATTNASSDDSDQDSDDSNEDDTDSGPGDDASPEQVVLDFMDKTKELALNPAAVEDPKAVIDEVRPYLCVATQEVLDELAEDLEEEDLSNDPGQGNESADLNAEFDVIDSNTDGDRAVVTVEVSYTDPITDTDQVESEDWELLQEDGTWKICDDF